MTDQRSNGYTGVCQKINKCDNVTNFFRLTTFIYKCDLIYRICDITALNERDKDGATRRLQEYARRCKQSEVSRRMFPLARARTESDSGTYIHNENSIEVHIFHLVLY